MLTLFAVSLGIAVSTAVFLVADLLAGRQRALRERLGDIAALGGVTGAERRSAAERVLALLERVGGRLQPGRDGASSDAEMLVHAGYRRPGALAIYWGARLSVGLGLGIAVMSLLPPLGVPPRIGLFAAFYFATVGYIAPFLYVRARRRARQKELERALPDALDMLVVCVEAGLGLNQALVRVAEEVRIVSANMSIELLQTNAEIRAGTPRDQALRQLAERNAVPDVGSLVTMLIQTDRFGTSIARSLRVHSDTMRQKRRQRAEEMAAKTAIKMMFPLVLCIFPAMFVVILGPALIGVIRALRGLG